MNLKRTISTIIISAIAVTAFSTTAFAHHGGGHGHRGGYRSTNSYSVCSVADCYLGYNHQHNGVTYAGHHNGDGHYYCR